MIVLLAYCLFVMFIFRLGVFRLCFVDLCVFAVYSSLVLGELRSFVIGESRCI